MTYDNVIRIFYVSQTKGDKKLKNKKRKEVHLDEKVVEALEKRAKLFNRKLKNHMETVLIADSKKNNKEFK